MWTKSAKKIGAFNRAFGVFVRAYEVCCIHTVMVCIIHTITRDGPMNSTELIRELTDDKWYVDRTNGSHTIMKHPTKPGHVTVPHPKKDLGIGLVKQIKRKAGI
jgi:predicted RNA binding protein YcfA (HicA-like mRNA interferase family)